MHACGVYAEGERRRRVLAYTLIHWPDSASKHHRLEAMGSPRFFGKPHTGRNMVKTRINSQRT